MFLKQNATHTQLEYIHSVCGIIIIIIKLVSTAEISTLLMHIIKAVISLSLPFPSTSLCQLLRFEVVLSHLYYEGSFLSVSCQP